MKIKRQRKDSKVFKHLMRKNPKDDVDDYKKIKDGNF